MEVLRIVLTLLQLRNVLCKNAWEIPDENSMEIQANVKKTTIVAYKKEMMTTDEITAEKVRIEKECKCIVENLASVGAFILTYNDLGMSRSLDLDPSKEIGVEDQIVTIYDQKIPADPDFKQQWSLQDLPNKADINAAEGWNAYMNDSKGGDPNGPSVIVAVIDTGVDYNHPDLKDVMWTNTKEIAGNGKDDDGNGVIDDVHGADYSIPPANGNPMDNHSHGTHCAGVIAAKENNDEGIAGVASFTQGKVKIMAVKGLADNGESTISGLFKSLNYAIANGAAISSNSWGGGWADEATDKAWSTVLRNNPNHLFVAAAGNSGKEFGDDYKPMTCGMKLPNLLCVGSSTRDNTMSGFSNYGKDNVDVMAPGSDIYSSVPGGRYSTMSGTSMACPHVSGLAALVKTIKPELTGQQIRQVIEANVQKKDVYKNVVSTGGIIDMGKTIDALGGELVQWSGIQANIWGDDQCKNVGNFGYLNFGLEDCKKKCLEIATCTAINYNGVNKDCVLRGCTRPVQPPQLQYGDYRGYYIMDKKDKCLTSPGYPTKYTDGLKERYNISVAAGLNIHGTFQDFAVEYGSDNCPYDYVQFSDANGFPVGQKLCGPSLPKDITIRTSTASLLFSTDGSVTEKGFNFCYRGVAKNEKCLTSPGYPTNYTDGLSEQYNISVAAGLNIRVTFQDFDVEFGGTNCPYDYIQFSDANGSPVGEKLCGPSLPKDITIGTSTASLLFSTDGSEIKKGFKFCYWGVAKP